MKYHYTYRITNTILNLHYYGTRTSTNRIPTEDIGIYYFSSSSNKEFINEQKLNPNNYKYKVIRVYNTRKEALELEIKLHSKFNVGINENFYNRAKQTSTGFDTTGIKLTRTKEHSQKLKDNNYNKLYGPSKETNMKNSLAHIGVSTGRTIPTNQQNKMHKAQKKTFRIFNKDNELQFECIGNFEKLCKDNNLPFGALKSSYQNKGKPIYRRKEDISAARKFGFEKFEGYYAIKLFKGIII